MISAVIATTIKIPTPIPALKIPSTTAQELNMVMVSTSSMVRIAFEMFIMCSLLNVHCIIPEVIIV